MLNDILDMPPTTCTGEVVGLHQILDAPSLRAVLSGDSAVAAKAIKASLLNSLESFENEVADDDFDPRNWKVSVEKQTSPVRDIYTAQIYRDVDGRGNMGMTLSVHIEAFAPLNGEGKVKCSATIEANGIYIQALAAMCSKVPGFLDDLGTQVSVAIDDEVYQLEDLDDGDSEAATTEPLSRVIGRILPATTRKVWFSAYDSPMGLAISSIDELPLQFVCLIATYTALWSAVDDLDRAICEEVAEGDIGDHDSFGLDDPHEAFMTYGRWQMAARCWDACHLSELVIGA